MFSSNATQVSSANYIEDVFSTYLYTGNGSTQTITNGIDLAGNGGLVWIKGRNTSAQSATSPHRVFDTLRGANLRLETNTTAAQSGTLGVLSSFNSDGFSINNPRYEINGTTSTYASWTFRKQPKFFDVVTYTGDGAGSRLIPHSLQSTPNCVIVKRTDAVSDWKVSHYSAANNYYSRLLLNSTAAGANGYPGGGVNPFATSTTVEVGTSWYIDMNATGGTYVAYLFAHNAGGFGLTGTDNVISCGSYTGTGGDVSVTLGYEPQWLLLKDSTSPDNWELIDTMRGWPISGTDNNLRPNSASAESSRTLGYLTATGFVAQSAASTPSSTFIYIAIRRGPMKVPTSGTSVFSVDYQGQYTPKPPGHTSGFVTDMALVRNKNTTNDMINVSRLTGDNYLITSSTAAAGSLSFIDFDYMNGWGDLSTTDANYYSWMWRRAPSFFDEVCYTGTGVTHTETHNLGVAPELIIVKRRASAAASWAVYAAPLTASYVGFLDLTNAFQADNMWNSTAPTSTAFTVRAANAQVNASGSTYVAYLFATCAGVSKVGSYTGTGATQTISCGFTGGARFVLVKRTDTTGDWYVWDTARGMVSGTDPSLLLNSTAAEVNANSIYTTTGGFQIVSTAAGINASGGTYIYLAIA